MPTAFTLLMAFCLPAANGFFHELLHLDEGSHLHGHGNESSRHAHGHQEDEHHVTNEVKSDPQRRISGLSGLLPLRHIGNATTNVVIPSPQKKSIYMAFVESLPPKSLPAGFLRSSQKHRAPPA